MKNFMGFYHFVRAIIIREVIPTTKAKIMVQLETPVKSRWVQASIAVNESPLQASA